MRLIAITAECGPVFEPEAIVRILDSGFERVHIRKPSFSEARMRELIEALPASVYPHLTLHDHHGLAVEYGLGGVQLNSRNSAVPAAFKGTVGRSCHSLAEAETAIYDYCTLSPVFDSISKQGYAAAFDLTVLSSALRGSLSRRDVFALGGVTPSRFGMLAELGFTGAALLGAVWHGDNIEDICENIRQIWKNCNS